MATKMLATMIIFGYERGKGMLENGGGPAIADTISYKKKKKKGTKQDDSDKDYLCRIKYL